MNWFYKYVVQEYKENEVKLKSATQLSDVLRATRERAENLEQEIAERSVDYSDNEPYSYRGDPALTEELERLPQVKTVLDTS